MIIEKNDPFTQASFTLDDRIRRALWNLVWLLLFRPSPRLFHPWRSLLLRLFGARVGRGVHVYPGVRIWAPWNLSIGNESGVADGAILYSMGPITIGERCVISQGAHLCGGSHDVDSPNFQLIAAPIVLEASVWICAEAFVGLGVRISKGCVVGARAVLMKSALDPWTVWVGNPATPRRKRLCASGGAR
jgi:putative colanic acid biosynthesis acetyltransferase WcaF